MAPRTPPGLDARGRKLWQSIVAKDPKVADPADARRDVALEACRIADQLEILNDQLSSQGLLLDDEKLGLKVHPALAESNKMRPLLARLIVALRLPDETTGAVPQRRGLRGVQATTKHKVSSLDRARAAAG
jgi:hypothetical protein